MSERSITKSSLTPVASDLFNNMVDSRKEEKEDMKVDSQMFEKSHQDSQNKPHPLDEMEFASDELQHQVSIQQLETSALPI